MISEFVIDDVRGLGKNWGVPDEGQVRAFLQYYELARRICLIPKKSLRVLELGSGFSTALLARMAEFAYQADGRDIRITSVDISFDTLNTISGEAGRDRLNCVCGATVTADAMIAFYAAATQASLMGHQLQSLIANSPFAKAVIDDRKLSHLKHVYKLPSLQALRQKLATDDLFYRNILDYYSNFGSLAKELDLIVQHPVVLNDDLLQTQWDVIYFDSGELSTNVEFLRLSQSFSPQCLVAFHDVWFPKSFKSWLPATAMTRSGEWRPIYTDETTSQGMFIVERVEPSVANRNGGKAS